MFKSWQMQLKLSATRAGVYAIEKYAKTIDNLNCNIYNYRKG